MIAENKIAIFLRQYWSLFPILIVMTLSGLYLALYIQTGLKIGYLWLPNNFHYWLIFPYRETYLAAIVVGFLFSFFGLIFIHKLNRSSSQAFIKNPLIIGWAIFSLLALIVLGVFILNLSANGSVSHLDSAIYKQHTLQLAYKNNMESGFHYYLFDCDRQTFQCEMVASFLPYDLIVWGDNARQSRLHIDTNGLATVIYNEQVIYEYSILSK